jgi:hypothetical protein
MLLLNKQWLTIKEKRAEELSLALFLFEIV